MLDERKTKAAVMKAQGIDVTKIAVALNITRTTFYNWAEKPDFKAELATLKQEYIKQSTSMLQYLAPSAVKKIVSLMINGDSSKVQLEAAKTLLDKSISNATHISIDAGQSDVDNVSADILADEMNEVDTDQKGERSIKSLNDENKIEDELTKFKNLKKEK